jgi:eukaryotic-like serine/threonine-protein kinase
MNPALGTVLNDRYTLTERLATGGMGEVWAATDTVLDRFVAVKLLNKALSQQAGFLARFRAEARCSAALHHPNITTMLDYGEDDGSPYLVMELVSGQPLSQIIAERAPLSARETVSILVQAANALEAAHQGGVVHRDVKPANIMVTPDGTAKLADFGISRMVDTVPLTQTGEVLGTPQYLSPEQALGQSATARSDIYALGVVGYEMLTARRPFDAETLVATALAHISQPPPPLPDTVPPGIRDVIGAALAKDPADRPVDAAAMAHALGMPNAATGAPRTGPALTRVLQVNAIAASGFPNGSPPARDRRRRSGSAVLLGAVAAVAIGVLAAVALNDTTDSTQTPATTAAIPPTSNPTGETPNGATPNSTTPNSATPSIGATQAVAPPANTSSRPGQLDRPRDRTRGHDDKKDGKK